MSLSSAHLSLGDTGGGGGAAGPHPRVLAYAYTIACGSSSRDFIVRQILCVRALVCVYVHLYLLSLRVSVTLLPAGGAGGGGGDDDDDAGRAGQCSHAHVRVHARVLLCNIFRGLMYDPVLSYVL